MNHHKVKLDAGFAGFAVVHPLGPVWPGNEKRLEEDIAGVLARYYFPVVNLVYSAAGEARCNPKTGKIELPDKLKKMLVEGEVKTDGVAVVNLQPSGTEVSAGEKSAWGEAGSFLTESGRILAESGAAAPFLSLAVPFLSGVGLILRTFFPSREKGLVVPYLNGTREFGWRRQESDGGVRHCEGIHYAQVLCVVDRREGSPEPGAEFFLEMSLQLHLEWESAGLQSVAWEKGGVRFQVPRPPKTPEIGDPAVIYNTDSIPLTFGAEEAARMLGLPGRELPPGLQEVFRPVPGTDPPRYTKGSLLKLLGLR